MSIDINTAVTILSERDNLAEMTGVERALVKLISDLQERLVKSEAAIATLMEKGGVR